MQLDRIRPNQEAVVKGYLEGRDVLFCSPIGSGKSLTFEVAPSAFKFLNNVNDATVIVVSSLVALIGVSSRRTVEERGERCLPTSL